jgi:hypothetical protein
MATSDEPRRVTGWAGIAWTVLEEAADNSQRDAGGHWRKKLAAEIVKLLSGRIDE